MEQLAAYQRTLYLLKPKHQMNKIIKYHREWIKDQKQTYHSGNNNE